MTGKQIMTLVHSQQDQIAAALPVGFEPGRVERMVRTAIATSEQLQKCQPRTVLGAVIECAQLGLEPGITGHLVPFWDSKTKGYRCQLIADYRGLIQLALRSGHVVSIYADVIREGDEWSIERGTSPSITHRPALGNTGPVLAAYAVARLSDGTMQFEAVPRVELDKVRDSVLGKMKEGARKYAPWTQHEAEMQKKTAVRRLCKFLPFSTTDTDLQRAIVLDEAADRGEQRLGATLEGDYQEETAEPEQPLGDEERAALGADITESQQQWLDEHEAAAKASGNG